MKKSILKSVAILVVLTAFFGCSSDSDSIQPTTPSVIVKTKVTITKIQITNIPTPNDWDLSSNPDIYVVGLDGNNNVLIPKNGVLWNFIPSITNKVEVNLIVPISTINLSSSVFKVQVWDDDSDDALAGANDKIGEVPFYISDYSIGANKYPSYAVKSNGETIVTIYMTWE
ncbi:hypothetical protein [Flavobacterium eburneipallidum]|uniref:hypothetical protein n=1 Tax=Flavobacterium eburneipallidum TaxID=3003263 RepID=UPI0022AC8358|nr:hypothetical protein [Flavobacterium eburneipallidum]